LAFCRERVKIIYRVGKYLQPTQASEHRVNFRAAATVAPSAHKQAYQLEEGRTF
jgi:hypothetical protein